MVTTYGSEWEWLSKISLEMQDLTYGAIGQEVVTPILMRGNVKQNGDLLSAIMELQLQVFFMKRS